MAPNFDTVINSNWLTDRCFSWSFPSVCAAIRYGLTVVGYCIFLAYKFASNAYSNASEWLMAVLMLMNIRRRDFVGHPWVHTGVSINTLTHLLTHACLLSDTHTRTHTCRLKAHTRWTLGCIIDKLLITLVAISADLSQEHPESL